MTHWYTTNLLSWRENAVTFVTFEWTWLILPFWLLFIFVSWVSHLNHLSQQISRLPHRHQGGPVGQWNGGLQILFSLVQGWRVVREEASFHGNGNDFSMWEDMECFTGHFSWVIIDRLAHCEQDFDCFICLCFLLLFHLHFSVCVMVEEHYSVRFFFKPVNPASCNQYRFVCLLGHRTLIIFILN